MKLLASRFVLVLITSLPASWSASAPGHERRAIRKRQNLRATRNYAGIQQDPPPDGSTYNYISATITVPQTTHIPSHGDGNQYISAWVGFGPTQMSGSIKSGASGLLQTGCGFINDGQGDQLNRCWTEFFPGPVAYFAGFSPSVGDAIGLELWRNSATQGTAKLTNLGTGAAVSSTFSAPSGHMVQGQMAEWIVEDQQVNGAVAPLAGFGSISFSGPVATTEAGNSYGPFVDGNYVICDMYASGAEQAELAVSSEANSAVVIDYVGSTS